jgi:CheY-like chemotaxis protein
VSTAIVRACLEDLGGWEAIAPTSAKEGLLLAQAQSLDAILLDVSMPDMDGFVFFEKLQENPVSQSIPVILLTAKVLPDDRARFAKMGVAGVINKRSHVDERLTSHRNFPDLNRRGHSAAGSFITKVKVRLTCATQPIKDKNLTNLYTGCPDDWLVW